MAQETVPLEFFLLLIVIFLGVMAAAASVQAFLLRKLIRELGRAYEDFDTARRSLGILLKDLATLTGTVNNSLNKGKDAISALDDAAEAVRTVASDMKSIVKKIFSTINTLTADIDTSGPERNDSVDRKSRPGSRSKDAKTENDLSSAVDTAEEEELLRYERPDRQEVR